MLLQAKMPVVWVASALTHDWNVEVAQCLLSMLCEVFMRC